MMKTLTEAYIIVVEDDPNDQLITLDLLRLGGANRCYAASSFAERMPDVDLFLVDINIPGRSGYELLTDIRNHATLNHVKVVALTAGTQQPEVIKARELGFDGFISKPLKPGEFANQVQDILHGLVVWDHR